MNSSKKDLLPVSFASARRSLELNECQFYHTMNIPGIGVVEGFEGGNWDLRQHLDDFLGGVEFQGKRVLEVGPASGLLTFEMERRGAEVVCAEIPSDHLYDVVPYPEIYEKWLRATWSGWLPLTNSWWFAHEHFGSKAKVAYIGAYDLDRYDLGRFDICILSNMLLHNRDPLKILTNCARITDGTFMVIDIADPVLEQSNLPLLRFMPEPSPTPNAENWNQWWRLSSYFISNALSVMGFRGCSEITKFSPPWNGIPIESYRVRADR